MMMRLLLLVFISTLAVGLQENEVMCGHRLYFNNVSWYTAYETCNQNEKVLALPETDVSSLIILLDVILKKVFKFVTFGRSNPGFWIGAFMRNSTNESMNFRCKLLHYEVNRSLFTEEILCLYYDFSEGEVRADSCNRNKPFICMNPQFEVSNCAMVSSLSTLKNSGQYRICLNIDETSNTTCSERNMKTLLVNEENNYAIINDTSKCVYYKYKGIECSTTLGDEVNNITHKSFFMFLDSIQDPLLPKPLSEWCPEMTPELIQKKIETRKRNLTIDRKNTAKYQRTLISAPDDRPSSKYMGMTGALVISLVAGLIVCIDLVNFSQKFKPTRVKIE